MRNNQLRVLVGTALLTAVIVVLQVVVGGISVGPFTITLSLIPMIIGAIMYGPISGAFLGAVLATLILIASLTGKDAGGLILITAKPGTTTIVIYLKTTLAGLFAGLAYNALQDKNEFWAVIVAAVLAPVTNTGLFSIACATFFADIVSGWAAAAGYSATLTYIVLGLVGINFLVEVGLNVLLVPAINAIVQASRKA